MIWQTTLARRDDWVSCWRCGAQAMPAIAQFLNDGDSSLVAEAARAINDEPIEAAQFALADLLGTPGLDDNTLRRSMNARYRRGFADDAAAVARIAAGADYSAAVRTVAAQLLATWNKPQNLDTVTGRWRPLHSREVARTGAGGQLLICPGCWQDRRSCVKRPWTSPRNLGSKTWFRRCRRSCMTQIWMTRCEPPHFVRLSKLSPDVPAVLQSGLKDPSESVRLAAVEIVTQREPQHAVPRLKELLDTGSLKAQQTALRLLGPIRTEESQAALQNAFDRLKSQQFPAGAVLDLITAAEVRGSEELKAVCCPSFVSASRKAGHCSDLWNECLEGGDVERGKTLFFGRSAAACRRCHKVAGSGGEVGPDLSKIGKEKDRNYLLEAMVDPSAKIAKGFETVIIVTMEGRIHSGILQERRRCGRAAHDADRCADFRGEG